MDNRFAGLVIVVLALFFLWLYDTGKWQSVKSAITGTPNTGGPGGLEQAGLSGFRTVPGAVPSAQNGGGQAWGATVCAVWPEACPFLGIGAPIIQGVEGAIGGIAGAIGDIFSGVF